MNKLSYNKYLGSKVNYVINRGRWRVVYTNIGRKDN